MNGGFDGPCGPSKMELAVEAGAKQRAKREGKQKSRKQQRVSDSLVRTVSACFYHKVHLRTRPCLWDTALSCQLPPYPTNCRPILPIEPCGRSRRSARRGAESATPGSGAGSAERTRTARIAPGVRGSGYVGIGALRAPKKAML